MRQSIKQARTHKPHGYSLFEVALALPPLIFLGLGVLDVVHYYRTYSALQQAIEEGLRCLYGSESCALPAQISEPLYSISANQADTATSLPYMTITGQISGPAESYLETTGATVNYLDRVNFIADTSKQLMERQYQMELRARYLARSNTLAITRANNSYAVNNGTLLNVTSPTLIIRPGQQASISFRTPDAPGNGNWPCRDARTFEDCAGALTQGDIVLLIEGRGFDGSDQRETIIDLELNGRSLGGRAFVSNGVSTDADFAPRGAAGAREVTGVSWNETQSYANATLQYGRNYTLRFKHRAGSAAWQVGRVLLARPIYTNKRLAETCEQPMTKQQALSSTSCTTVAPKINTVINSLPASAITLIRGAEAQGATRGLVACDYQEVANTEFYTAPRECSSTVQSQACEGTTTITGVPNYGVIGDLVPDSESWKQAQQICPGPQNSTILGWSKAQIVMTKASHPELFSSRLLIEDCDTQSMQSQLTPAQLSAFTDAEMHFERSNTDTLFKPHLDLESSAGTTQDLSCLPQIVSDISSVLPQTALSIEYSGCDLTKDNVAQRLKQNYGLATHIDLQVQVTPSQERYNTSGTLDSCQQELAVTSTIALRSYPLALPPMTEAAARAYCQREQLLCSFQLVGYQEPLKDVTERIDTGAAEQKSYKLFQAFAGQSNVDFSASAYRDPSQQVIVEMQGQITISSLLGKMLPYMNEHQIQLKKSRISEKTLL